MLSDFRQRSARPFTGGAAADPASGGRAARAERAPGPAPVPRVPARRRQGPGVPPSRATEQSPVGHGDPRASADPCARAIHPEAHRRHPPAKRFNADFGPTFAHQKLTEQHGLAFSVPRGQRLRRSQPPRPRRACLGELVQIDGSEHAWFEDRGPVCTLLVYVDDATSRLMELAFAEVESTFDYFRATRRYLERHGKPMAFYSDRLSVFHVHARERAQNGRGLSQFGRALRELNVDLLCARSPEAKGRVERANGTLQDRLVKELRLRGLNDPIAAAPFLPVFRAD